MGDCHLFHDEIRISVRDPEKTELWVYIRGEGDCPFQCLGWHYKAFPSTITSYEVLQRWTEGLENPLGWERRNPPQTENNYELPDYVKLLEDKIVKGELPDYEKLIEDMIVKGKPLN